MFRIPSMPCSAYLILMYKTDISPFHAALKLIFMYNTGILSFCSALNNDAWHSVELVIDVRKRELRLSLDGESTRETLKAYTWGNAEDILMWSHLKAVVSLGGVCVCDSRFQLFVFRVRQLPTVYGGNLCNA